MFSDSVESLRVHSLWLLKKALPSREEPDISLSIMNSKVRFYTHALRACHIISPKRGSAPNTRSIDFIRRYIERVASRKKKIAVRGDGGVAGVAGERNVVGVP